MSSDYESITRFIRDHMIGAGLSVNHLSNPRSAASTMMRRFEELGWRLEDISPSQSRFSRKKAISPDGRLELNMVGAKVYRHSRSAEEICRRKHLTKRMLGFDGVPVPQGADFYASEKEVAGVFFEKMPKPVVVKPTDAGSSEGVTVGVSDRAAFTTAWDFALAEGRKHSNVLVEQFVKGVELRAYVIGSEVVSVVARIQPFVVGTNEDTIEELIQGVHEHRKVNHRANRMPIEVNWEFVLRNGYDVTSIPKRDEIVFLNPLTIPLAGASVVDVTDLISEDIKLMARRAKDAVPGLEIAGVDLLVEDLEDASTAVVLEVNTAAALDLHRYPTYGPARAVDLDTVDYFHSEYLKTSSSVL